MGRTSSVPQLESGGFVQTISGGTWQGGRLLPLTSTTSLMMSSLEFRTPPSSPDLPSGPTYSARARVVQSPIALALPYIHADLAMSCPVVGCWLSCSAAAS